MSIHIPLRDTVDMYWSGGWDSTFYLLYLLSQTTKTIRAFYVEPVRRKTRELELAAIHVILDTFTQEWLNRLTVSIVERPAPPRGGNFYCEEVREVILKTPNESYETIVPQLDLFVYLTQIMDIVKPAYGIETPVVKTRGCFERIEKHVQADGSLSNTCDKKWHVLQSLSFPLIHLKKTDMLRMAQDHKFIDILKLSTSCLDGTGCRKCDACHDIIEIPEMQFRLM